MSADEAFQVGPGGGAGEPGGLLDVLNVAAIVLDSGGRIVLWSPQAEELFGYTAAEALGEYAARLMVHPRHTDLVIRLFQQVMALESDGKWAGVFPIRHKDGSTLMVEFRNMRLLDSRGALYALGIATDSSTVRSLETDLALSTRLVSQSPIGLGVLDTGLRYVTVNPALERINGLPAAEHIGRHVREALPFVDTRRVEESMRAVLCTGTPLVDQFETGRSLADPDTERAWSVSYYRLEDPGGRVLGLATSVVDVTERHRAATEAARARCRLSVIADATVRIGTTLDLDRTARELADVSVPALADAASVDLLDSALDGGRRSAPGTAGPALFRTLAVSTAYPDQALPAASPVGQLARYDRDRLVARCVDTGQEVLVPRCSEEDLDRVAATAESARLLAEAGVHSYLAVPLTARGEVLGALELKRAHNPVPFDDDDLLLARELAARAAVCIDNARWYQRQRQAALSLQRTLLPRRPPQRAGLRVAYRYLPAETAGEVGGDWFDVIPLNDDRTALVVGDVMGNGIQAAAAMGQLRTATRALSPLGLRPDELIQCVDTTTAALEHSIATCVYAVYDPHRACCEISTAGHLPPVVISPDRGPELLDLSPGAPLGVGGVPFDTVRLDVTDGTWLILYTDGLLERRDEPIDARLHAMLRVLGDHEQSLEATCDLLLSSLREPGHRDDVALLVARFEPLPRG